LLDTSEAPLLQGGGTAFRAARKRKRFRYEDSANLRRPFKKRDAHRFRYEGSKTLWRPPKILRCARAEDTCPFRPAPF